MKTTTYKIWYWKFDENDGMYDYGRRVKEYVRYGNAVNVAKKTFVDTDYKWLVSQTCPWETYSELCKKAVKDLPKRAECKECFHYEACLDADTEEYMLHGEFPEECKHFIDKKYVHINKPLMTVDDFLAWVKERYKQIEQRRVYEKFLEADNIVMDENGKPMIQERKKYINETPSIEIPILKIDMDVDISKEMALLGENEKEKFLEPACNAYLRMLRDRGFLTDKELNIIKKGEEVMMTVILEDFYYEGQHVDRWECYIPDGFTDEQIYKFVCEKLRKELGND